MHTDTTPPKEADTYPTPPGGRPPQEADTPPQEADPPRARPPKTQTPQEAGSGIRSMSGRYASYWNAFLLLLCNLYVRLPFVVFCLSIISEWAALSDRLLWFL